MARLDRLGPAKEVAQIGAAIGREFSHALIAAVVRASETELNSALDRLIAAGLLFRQGVPPHAIYQFKHALVQDAAYGTLLREPRCALHARISEILESQFAELTSTRPELLARAPMPVSSKRLRDCGAKPGSDHRSASLWSKRSHSSHAPSTKLRHCPQRPRCAANRSSFRLGLRTLCIIRRALPPPRQERRLTEPTS
jgi:hypothetical protein